MSTSVKKVVTKRAVGKAISAGKAKSVVKTDNEPSKVAKKTKPKKIIYEDKLEQLDFPGKTYTGEQVRDAIVAFIKAHDCFGVDIDEQRDMVAEFFTLIETAWEDRHLEKCQRKIEFKKKLAEADGNAEEISLIPCDFDEKTVWDLFKSKDGVCKYLRVKIAPSAIKAAGMGAYSVDPIPKGASCTYRGIERGIQNVVSTYSWEVKPYKATSGDSVEGKPLFYLDASDPTQSNTTRFYNCGLSSKSNNFDIEQRFTTINYVALRDIEPGIELFCDYGSSYRRHNLNMVGKY